MLRGFIYATILTTVIVTIITVIAYIGQDRGISEETYPIQTASPTYTREEPAQSPRIEPEKHPSVNITTQTQTPESYIPKLANLRCVSNKTWITRRHESYCWRMVGKPQSCTESLLMDILFAIITNIVQIATGIMKLKIVLVQEWVIAACFFMMEVVLICTSSPMVVSHQMLSLTAGERRLLKMWCSAG